MQSDEWRSQHDQNTARSTDQGPSLRTGRSGGGWTGGGAEQFLRRQKSSAGARTNMLMCFVLMILDTDAT